MLSLFVVWCAIVVDVAVFVGLRFAVAGLAGLKGRAARFGFAPEPWGRVPGALRLAFAVAGPVGCYLIAAACFALSLLVGGEAIADRASLRVSPEPGRPAATSGVEEGDRVVSIDGERVADWDAIKAAVRAHRGRPMPIVVERAGEERALTPIVGDDARIGIAPVVERRGVSVGRAVVKGLASPFDVIAASARAVLGPTTPAEIVGPVGLVREVAKTSNDRSPLAASFGVAGGLLSYFLWIPALAAGILFPRKGTDPGSSRSQAAE